MNLCGQAGTYILMLPCDIRRDGMHSSPRLPAWVRYGTGVSYAYHNDNIQPVSGPGRVPDHHTRLILK